MSLVERRRRLPSVNEVDRERGVGDTLEPEVSREDVVVAGIDFFFFIKGVGRDINNPYPILYVR